MRFTRVLLAPNGGRTKGLAEWPVVAVMAASEWFSWSTTAASEIFVKSGWS